MGLDKKRDRESEFYSSGVKLDDLSPFFRDCCFNSLLICCLIYAGMLNFLLILCASV